MRRLACAAVLAVAASAVTAPAASASSYSSTVGCTSQAYVYTVRQNGDLWFYSHGDAANGTFTWWGSGRIGTGWGGRTLGRDGNLIYNITDSGELRQFDFDGRGFRQLPHGGYYDAVGSGWQLYTAPEYRNRIAFGEDGALYSVDQQGNLRWWFFDVTAKSWHPESGRVLATGWDQFDAITAAGPGVLQARRPDGSMVRYRYHRDSQRMMREGTSSGYGWQMFEKMFSFGGDLLYGVNRHNGDLTWYSYDEPGDRWASDVGRVVGEDWGGLRDITSSASACRTLAKLGPEQGGISGDHYAPAAVETASGVLHTFQAKDNGFLVHGTMTDPKSFQSVVADARAYQNVLRPNVTSSGVAEVYGTERSGAHVNRWAADGHWLGTQEHAGYLKHAPAVHTRANGTVALYGVVDGQLWLRDGTLPWRRLGGAELTGYPTVARASDSSVTLLVRNRAGRLFEVAHTASGLGEFHEYAGPQLFSDGVIAVTDGAGVRRLFARSQQGHVVVAGPDREFRQLGAHNTSEPGVAVAADGTIWVVARGSGGKFERTSQVAPGSGEFGAWLPVGEADVESGSDPALVARRSGEMALLYRYGARSLRYCSLTSAVSCTTLD